MTTILAIDPGPTKSGWLIFSNGTPAKWGWTENEKVQAMIYGGSWYKHQGLVIEDVTHYGMAVGKDVFDTAKWIGRFDNRNCATLIPRPEIKLHLCGDARAKDANIRQALIDRYGGQEKAIGGKKCSLCHGSGLRGRGKARGPCPECVPNYTTENLVAAGRGSKSTSAGLKLIADTMRIGYETPKGPLHGISNHVWSALAVAVTYWDRVKE